jgi:hypothetical protein
MVTTVWVTMLEKWALAAWAAAVSGAVADGDPKYKVPPPVLLAVMELRLDQVAAERRLLTIPQVLPAVLARQV